MKSCTCIDTFCHKPVVLFLLGSRFLSVNYILCRLCHFILHCDSLCNVLQFSLRIKFTVAQIFNAKTLLLQNERDDGFINSKTKLIDLS